MLKLDFINVGYGDAILLRHSCAEGEPFTMLVDCGDLEIVNEDARSQRMRAADFLYEQGIRHLDLLVLTHLHLDHSGGLFHLLPQVSVSEFWTNYLPDAALIHNARLPQTAGMSPGAQCLVRSLKVYLGALEILRRQNASIQKINCDMPVRLFGHGLAIETFCGDEALYREQDAIFDAVLSGTQDDPGLDRLDHFINNTSIRLRVHCSGHVVELPGDVYAACWEKSDLKPCSVLKLPHHGHSDAFSEKLAAQLSPRCAVVTVSNTRCDNCPSAEVLSLLRRHGAETFFTDAVGERPDHHRSVSISICADGKLLFPTHA